MLVTLIQATPYPIQTIATIASICYDSNPSNPKKLVEHCYKNGHLSVMEHIYFTFKIEGISRACSHQLVRHRHCSFTQRSQRYCSEDDFGYVIPPTIKENGESDSYIRSMNALDWDYAMLTEAGIANEDARYVLPNACETSLYLSCNLRELIHMSNERLCRRAQWEIRELVQQMVNLVPADLRFMLVPKCKSGRIICHEKCGGAENEAE